ncbi:NADH-quinone oxidoreductase subunit L [Microbulbifer aggregans]|uniref:NADH-quinone oxidoreductase subunit L n=1 Tax=Microbulbifer aggregans TaxID=1769779 RepID=A0A1C9W835_9GAMM|nr:NADH-quinone oxidoreductase subunit L [Microbulbifer aggregans]AOS97300.1 NADH-quinone oxidoreductase subunit L [Microbulbifer aggregans]
MQSLLALIPLLPLSGFLLLVCSALLLHRQPRETAVAWVAVGAVALAAVASATLFFNQFLGHPESEQVFAAGPWIKVAALQLGFDLYADWLTMVMLLVISGVGFLIHLYSVGYMRGDGDFRRYFAYLNLFVAAMLILVLADNLVLLYLGWEGVGLCSYLLIGFWYRNRENGRAAIKAFLVTRIGDTALAIGLFLLFREYGTLQIRPLLDAVTAAPREPVVSIAALLLLGGAVGKSAQLPLQTWLPDAMAGPTPVSALIHAATMVTAGVYLIARLHPLFALSDLAMTAVASVGALTLLMAGCSALMQADIKRVLAYSTISQLGYMFLALGVGAWPAAIFHLMTHAFFKALLFLAAGSIILSLHHEQALDKMGGLYRKLPFTFFTFAVGCACLAALPLTSGFSSKEAILAGAWENGHGLNLFWMAGILGAVITGAYTARLLLKVFFGPCGTASAHCDDANRGVMRLPLLTLSLLALVGGLLVPQLQAVFENGEPPHPPLWTIIVAIAAPIIGALLAWMLFRHPWAWLSDSAPATFWRNGWGFDTLYSWLLVRPFRWLAQLNRNDIIDGLWNLTGAISRQLHGLLSLSQNGQLRWYLATLAGGLALFLALVVIL